jgi:hypothetical protein
MLEQNKKRDDVVLAATWFAAGIVMMGLFSILIDLKTHNNIEFCSSTKDTCQIWIIGVDKVGCKVIVQTLNDSKNNEMKDSFYMCK